MKRYIPHIFSAWLIIGFSCLATERGVSQTNQNGNEMDTASSVTAMAGGTSPYGTGLTPERAKTLIGGVVGLISLMISWRAKARSSGRNGRTWAIVALVLGLTAIGLSVMHLTTTIGAFGTGSGKAGAIVTLTLGLIGTTFSGLALSSKQK